MADKKRKPSAKNLYKSSRDKLVKEFVENAAPDDAKSEQSTIRQGSKGNASKAIKKAIKSNKPEGSTLKKTPMQAALTASPNKAVKELIKDRYQKAQEAQKRINKEYRKELNKLRRRVGYFEGKGFQFDLNRIAPKLEGNATQEEIDYLKAIRGKVLQRMATGFEPPIVQTDEVPVSEIVDNISGENALEDLSDNAVLDADEDYADLGENGLSWEDTISDEHRDDVIPPLDETTPQDRYYRDNEDRVYDGDSRVQEGKLILQNIYDDIENQLPRLTSELDMDNPYDADLMNAKHSVAMDLLNMIEEAIERLGEDRVCELLEENADVVKQTVEQICYDIYVSKDRDYDDVMADTEASLLAISSILNDDSPGALMAQTFGGPTEPL